MARMKVEYLEFGNIGRYLSRFAVMLAIDGLDGGIYSSSSGIHRVGGLCHFDLRVMNLCRFWARASGAILTLSASEIPIYASLTPRICWRCIRSLRLISRSPIVDRWPKEQ